MTRQFCIEYGTLLSLAPITTCFFFMFAGFCVAQIKGFRK